MGSAPGDVGAVIATHLHRDGTGFGDPQQRIAEGGGFTRFHTAKAWQHTGFAPGHSRQVRIVAGHQAVAAEMPVKVFCQRLYHP